MQKVLCLVVGILLFPLSSSPQATVKKDGYNKLYYPSGKLASEGTTRDGKPDGYWKNYYESGTLKSAGNRKDFKLDGIWKFYNEDSTLQAEITFSNDQRNGFSWTYLNGKLEGKSYYKDNVLNGESYTFYENGTIRSKSNYVNGQLDGDAFEYASDDKRIITIMRYNKDLLVSRDEINRYNSNGLEDGKWVTFHSNGINKLVGGYIAGKKSGIFKEYDQEGKLIAIYKYEDGVLAESSKDVDVLEERKTYHPNAKIKSLGTYRDGKLQGFLKEYNSSGELVKSALYEQDVKLAEGLIDELGREQGSWKYFHETGELKAEGKYKDGKKIGEWKYYFVNGKLEQQGNYVNGLPNGPWIWYHQNGKIHREEEYKLGKEDGNAEEYDQLGYLVSKGKYVDGKREGKWFYYVGDHLEEGKYRDGNKDGRWEGYYDEDRKERNFIGDYKDGAEDGTHTYYYPGGIMKEVRQYKAGVKDGNWVNYKEDGTVFLNSEYRNGELVKVNGVPVKIDKKEKPSS